MENYQSYRLTLTCKSPFITPLQSDTLFGHICWALLHLLSKNDLEKFLAAYETEPPLLISEGFPKGMLPKPVWKPIPKQEAIEIFKTRNLDTFSGATYFKSIRRISLIPYRLFDQLKETLSSRNIFSALLDYLVESNANQKNEQEILSTTYHNTINRLTGTVIEGLYTVEETFRGEDFQFEVYLRSKSLSKSELQSILQYISLSGFGKDKSTGRGHFEFDEQDLVEFNIEDADNANGFVTLSSYVPDSEAPLNGHYDLLIKYPKLAGDFETAFDNVSSPFKHPVAMMRSGAVFHSYERNRPYGALVAGVHKQNNSIMQYGLAFPVGVQIEE